MPSFDNLDDLFKYIEKDISMGIFYAGIDVRKLVRDFISNKLYNTYHPTQYVRTYDFLNSVSIRVIDDFSVEVYYDTSLIRPSYEGVEFWYQHMNVYPRDENNPKRQSEYIPLWIEYGTDSKVYSRGPLLAMETIYNDKKTVKNILQSLKIFLKKEGYKIKGFR